VKHLRYLLYVLKHKWFVFLGALKLRRTVPYYRVPWLRLLIHDWSKFTPSEWRGYVERFFGDSTDSAETKRAFAAAWKHHYTTNDHHWEWWSKQPWMLRSEFFKEPFKMADECIFEMVADWMGAGRGITGKWEMPEWYSANRDRIELHPDTRKLVDAIVDDYDNYVPNGCRQYTWEE
jgi:hypothetical protein